MLALDLNFCGIFDDRLAFNSLHFDSANSNESKKDELMFSFLNGDFLWYFQFTVSNEVFCENNNIIIPFIVTFMDFGIIQIRRFFCFYIRTVENYQFIILQIFLFPDVVNPLFANNQILFKVVNTFNRAQIKIIHCRKS
jgi:hypothetical protein